MKLKKWLSLFLVLCMLFSFAACGSEEYYTEDEETKETTEATTTATTEPQQTEPTETTTPEETDQASSAPLLYKVTDSQGNVAWLFGSIHVGAEYYYPLPNYVTAAYYGADALAVEFDIIAYESDLQTQMSDMMQLMYTDGTTISSHLPAELYNEAVQILTENNMYSAMMDVYCISMWATLIDNITYEKLGVRTDLGIDRHLLEQAYTDNKTILNVESSTFQYGMMAEFSEELQTILLETAIAGYKDQAGVSTDLEEMLALWASGDEAAFTAYLCEEEAFSSPEEEALYEEYNNAMLISRNLNMASFVEDVLKTGQEVFVCVGAAHVVGPGAMVELLRQRGYTVELVGV